VESSSDQMETFFHVLRVSFRIGDLVAICPLVFKIIAGCNVSALVIGNVKQTCSPDFDEVGNL